MLPVYVQLLVQVSVHWLLLLLWRMMLHVLHCHLLLPALLMSLLLSLLPLDLLVLHQLLLLLLLLLLVLLLLLGKTTGKHADAHGTGRTSDWPQQNCCWSSCCWSCCTVCQAMLQSWLHVLCKEPIL